MRKTSFQIFRAAVMASCLIAILGISRAEAQSLDSVKKLIAECASTQDTIRRGECYDNLAKKLGLDKPARNATKVGKWEIMTDVSKIDDTKSVYLSVLADKEVRIGRYDRTKPILWVRCRENETSVFVVYNHFLGSDEISVTLRRDAEAAMKSDWSISTNHFATGLWGGSSAIEFIKSLYGKRQLLVRLTPYSESSVTVSFDISGLKSVIPPLAKACGWAPPEQNSSSEISTHRRKKNGTKSGLQDAQRALAALGLYDGKIDGIWGPGTRKAVKQFQKLEFLPITGELDSFSLYRLKIRSEIK